MSKAKSPSRSRSRSGSRSRSRSFSRSRSQSRSRSRSRKHRYSSRSRSRSRSHSPAHNRDRDYPREYQNNRQFRGYHRGFRRPYYYRGRGRGYFPRGRYQRGGGGGGYNNNYRPNNWQNYRQHPQQQQPPPPPHHPHSPRRGRSRSRTPKKRSGSPRSRSRSRYSDRSSSGRSRRSHRSSSSSSSRSSSPRRPRRQRRRSGSGSGSAKDKEKESSKEKRGSLKDAKERSASKEAAARAGSGSRSGSATGGAEPDPEGGAGGAPGEDGNAPERPGSGNWQGLTDYSASPKRASPQLRSAVVSVPGQPSPTPKSSGSSTNSATPWHGGGTAPPAQSPKQKSPTAAFSGFGFFSKEDHRAGDKSAISAAFKKFLEEHKNKKQVAEWENGRDKEPGDAADGEPEKGPAFDRAPGYGAPKEKEKYSKYGAGFETGGGGAGGGFLKAAPPFLCAEEEEEDEEVEKMAAARRPPKPRKDREADQPQVKLSTRELFEERFGKWDDLAYFPSGKERPRKAPEGEGEEPDEAEEELYRARKQERAKKEALFRGFSPDKAPQKTRKKEPPGLSPSPPAAPRRGGGSDTRDRDTFLVHRDGSPVRASAKRGGDLAVRMESFRDDAASSSGVLVTERRLSRDLVHPSKKEQEFRSIFQHIQNTQLCRSPSELFAQHIVNIVHQIKAQHFPSSGLTLNERFALYQRRAAEKEMAKPRKSPEIHRRIDVSPSAFKKHSQSHLFDDMKASGDGGYKDDRKRGMKGEAVDLRLDIERRKKYSGKEAEHRREPGRDSADSQGSSRERSGEKYSKHHKKSKKSKKKRERSRSSSASSSSSPSHRAGPGDFLHEDMEPKEEGGFNKARLGPREFGGPMERGRARGGFQFRIRGRGWNRGSYPGNNSNGNPPNMGPVPTHPKSEDWDPEYTPKSRKYYLVGYKREVEDQSTHDDREGEGDKKWLDNRGRGRGNFLRGRGRFILRKAPPTSNSPKWTHDKFQGSGEEGELRDDDSEQDHKEEDKAEQ